MTVLKLVESKIVPLEIPENLPNFDIIIHGDEEESWFKEAIERLEAKEQ